LCALLKKEVETIDHMEEVPQSSITGILQLGNESILVRRSISPPFGGDHEDMECNQRSLVFRNTNLVSEAVSIELVYVTTSMMTFVQR